MESPGFIARFDEQVARHPERVAICHEQMQLSYAALQEQSIHIARVLRARGCGQGSIIGLWLPASAEWIVAMMAVLRCGAVYVPIDPSFPPQRRASLLKQCRAQAGIGTDEGLFEGIPFWSVQGLMEEMVTTKAALPVLSPASLAYLIFTSGTSGTPKGVKISHGNLNAYLSAAAEAYFGKSPDTPHCFALISSPAYDLAVTAIHLPLSSGHAVKVFALGNNIINSKAAMSDPTVTALKCTPSHLGLLDDGDYKASLRLLVLGGEALPTAEARHMQQLFPRLAIYNEYGPTEVTVGCIVERYDKDQHQHAEVPIGQAMQGSVVALFSESGDCILPEAGKQSASGELWLSGPQLSTGYWEARVLTDKKFVSGPAGEGIWYRSGDRAHYDANGALVYESRMDEQVKIGGYRIEPAEIVRMLETLPGIQQAHILLQQSKGQKSLLACFRAGRDISYQELMRHLRARLPYWMIPETFAAVPYMPVQASGKIDPERLLALARKSLFTSTAMVPAVAERAQSKAEAIIALASQAAGIPVSLGDNLLDAGIDSIRLLQLTRVLSDSFDHELPISQVITEPTGKHLLEMLEEPDHEQLLFTLQEGERGDVFCFPAAVGGILPFRNLLRYLPGYRVHAFAFAESEDLIARYATAVKEHGAERPVFIGYSGGGNLAWGVARALDREGKGPQAVVMLDAFRKAFLPQALPKDILQMKEEALAVFTEEEQPLFAEELAAYYDFINLQLCDHEGSISADVHLLCSANRGDFGDRRVDKRPFFQSWESATTGNYREYIGAGLHHELMQEPWLTKNAAIIEHIIKQAIPS